MKKGLLAGSFDPPTFGHLDIIERATALADELIIGIGINPSKAKNSILTLDEKKELLEPLLNKFPNTKVKSFEGLAVDFAKKEQVNFLIRGIRAFSDFEYEFRMAIANKKMASLETLFLMADLSLSQINSTLIKEIASFKGPLDSFVPEVVARRLREKSL